MVVITKTNSTRYPGTVFPTFRSIDSKLYRARASRFPLLPTNLDEVELPQHLLTTRAGMPFLFVDQLVVQAPQGASAEEGNRMRVLLGVSGQWQGAH